MRFKANGGTLSAPAIGRDQTIYLGGDKLYALDGKTGRKKWTFRAGSFIDSSPSIDADGIIYFGCYDQKLYAVDRAGKLKWTFKTGGSISTNPAIGADGTIYFTTDNGYLFAIH